MEDLLARGVLCKVNTAISRVGDATSKMVRPVPDYEGKLTPRQRDVYQTLLDCGEASEKELCYFTRRLCLCGARPGGQGGGGSLCIRGVPPP